MLLAVTWFFLEVGMSFYPMLFPVFIFAALYVLYTGKQSILLFLVTIASIAFWLEYSLAYYWRERIYFDIYVEHLATSISLFILAYVVGYWLNLKPSIKAKDYGAVLGLWSLRFGLIFMLVMSFEGPWRNLIRQEWQHVTSMLFIVGLFSIATLMVAYHARKLYPVSFILAFYLLTLFLLFNSSDTTQAVYFQIVCNIVLISSGVWLIVRGIQNGISHYFFLGIASILVTAFARYIDLIGDYVGSAMLFLVFAVLLIGAAKYWKRVQLTGDLA